MPGLRKLPANGRVSIWQVQPKLNKLLPAFSLVTIYPAYPSGRLCRTDFMSLAKMQLYLPAAG
jgi:hypothetical protein